MDPEISVSLSIGAEGTGAIHTVPIGLTSLPTILIRAKEAEDGVLFEVLTGSPFEQTVEGVGEIADVLELLVETLRGTSFTAAWAAGLEETVEEVSETGKES